MRNFHWISNLGLAFVSVTALSQIGCSQGFEAKPQASSGSNAAADVPETPMPAPIKPPADPKLNICSQLDFNGIAWPATLSDSTRKAMALSLNITGSFEGGGWSNLANNFDGQGISLGLNQQNLGQGTLQPIFKVMIDKNLPLTQTLFTAASLKSVSSMVSIWSKSVSAAEAIEAMFTEKPLFSENKALSPLDEGFEGTVSALASRNSVSVAWAVENVYQSGGTAFKADWKQSLKAWAASAPFRSLQVQESNSMFAKASGYFNAFKFHDMRSLLLMYDFVVQNGGFTAAHQATFRTWDTANPKASETARTLKLLEIRLVSVRAEYRGDVDSRKRTIITGTGKVHGASRNLQTEYCYSSAEPIVF